MTNTTWGGNRLLHPTTVNSHTIHHWKKSGRSLEADNEAEAIGESSYGFAPRGFLSLLSYSTQNHQPRGGTTPGELGLLTSIIKQKKGAHNCPQANVVGTFSQFRPRLPK